jgi:diguanylate cyclase (GGDEF)-like protein/PAS domain S-box-containing protein
MDADYISTLEQRVKQLALELEQTKAQLKLEQQERAQVEATLRKSNEQLYQILDSTNAGIAFVDAERRYQFVNRFYEVRFNRSRESILNKYVWDVIGEDAYASTKAYVERVLTGEPQRFEFSIIHRNGDQAYLTSCLTPAFNSDQEVIGYYLFVFDSTERHRLEQSLLATNTKLKKLATVDSLTQIANRRKFDDYLEQEWRCALRGQQPLSLIMFDIDAFKRYNDHYGHQIGDDCLISIAQTVKLTVERAADVVARYGGEEFAVVLPNTNLSGAIAIAEQIHDAVKVLAIPHESSSVGPIVSISLGIASLVPTAVRSPADLIARADRALYAAKQQGRDRYVVASTQGQG